MSGFANSIVGGMSKLIRKAIQSPNYVTGVSGWSINDDGTAEFNNVDVRGTIELPLVAGPGEVGTLWFNDGLGSEHAQIFKESPSLIISGGTDSVVGADAFIQLAEQTATENGSVTLWKDGNFLTMQHNGVLISCQTQIEGLTILSGDLAANGNADIVGDLTRGAGSAYKGKFYFMRCNLSSAQAFPSGANTQINWTPLAGSSDYGNCFSSGTFTAPVDGIYMFSEMMSWTDEIAAHLNLVARLNGTQVATENFPNPNSGTTGNMLPTFAIDMKAGDAMNFLVFQSSGSTWHADFLTPYACWLSVFKLP